jgi:hypothetical protein
VPLQWLGCPRGAPDEPGGLPQAGIYKVPIRSIVIAAVVCPQHPLHHLRVGACLVLLTSQALIKAVTETAS